MTTDKAIYHGDPAYPPGMTSADIDAGVTRLDDLSPAELWELLNDDQRGAIYREFFRLHWDELACCLDDHEASSNARHNSPSLGQSFRSLWQTYRDAAVDRLALNEKITRDRYQAS